MRRSRKPRVVWLPQTNANSLGAVGELTSTVYQLDVFGPSGAATGDTGVIEIPLVLDAQTSFADTGATLSDIESSGYRLRRIVGKIWVQMAQTDPNRVNASLDVEAQSVIVTAGIMVRRTDVITGNSMGSLTRPADINPALIENTGDPWIWRRSWLLGNQWAGGNFAGVGAAGSLTFWSPLQYVSPTNYIAGTGGNADGPHVDQKTARIVGSEERLFLDVSATVLGESLTQPGTAPTIAVITDLRVLGSLRTTVGNRRNAAR